MAACSPREEKDWPIIEWNPADIIRPPSNATPPDYALLVLNQPIHNHVGMIKRLWNNASFRIAADGGANCLYDVAGVHSDPSFDDLHVIIGDLDSITQAARTYYEAPPRKTNVIYYRDDYSTDFAKAIEHIRQKYPPSPRGKDIVAVGSLGGRVDHGISQLHHLYLFQQDPDYNEGKLYFFSGESLTFMLKAGRKHSIRVRHGSAGEDDVFAKWVGILPVREPSRITTKGLEWDVTDWPTEFGGQMSTSNHILPETQVVEVEATKDVLFTMSLRQI
ncbi:putative thiamine pyrophosphokinase [Triangularia verruculosa]|uniref:Thiamine pyrophosphokinase n=1 Tax=Triangularia verruculosa TaxID=2587418 RepID=A0AAN6XPS6_9PEZI|nr:putative thiamine pyrophosphokinase [Triangularia verruculosa]